MCQTLTRSTKGGNKKAPKGAQPVVAILYTAPHKNGVIKKERSKMHTNLKEYRVKKKLTQKQMAERTGLKESAYQRYEYGECAPSVWTAIRIARARGTTVERLWFPALDRT